MPTLQLTFFVHNLDRDSLLAYHRGRKIIGHGLQ
jgi:hypothetical protein